MGLAGEIGFAETNPKSERRGLACAEKVGETAWVEMKVSEETGGKRVDQMEEVEKGMSKKTAWPAVAPVPWGRKRIGVNLGGKGAKDARCSEETA